MSDPKTRRTGASVREYLDAIPDAPRRRDAKAVAKLMRRATGERPRMWGSSIVGYGSYHFVYASGRKGDWMATGFSSRKQALTLYIMSGFEEHEALEELVVLSVAHVRARYGATAPGSE